MASSPPSPASSPEELVADLFRAADHEVQQTVGLEPGTVDWFATPNRGFVRPRTYFQVLAECPENIEATIRSLEAARVARGADRAMAIALKGALPGGYTPDLHHSTSNLLTFRRWLLEISGIAERTRSVAQSYEQDERHQLYLPRRARLSSGDEVQVESFIDAWLEQPRRPALFIDGPASGGKTSVIQHSVYRAAVRFARNAESAAPLVRVVSTDLSLLWGVTWGKGFAVPAITSSYVNIPEEAHEWQGLFEARRDDGAPGVQHPGIRLELIPPSSDEIGLLMRDRIGAAELADTFDRARLRHPGFRDLSDALPNIEGLLRAVRAQANGGPTSTEQWVASVVIEYANFIDKNIGHFPAGPVGSGARTFEAFEDRALQEFALGIPLGEGRFGYRAGGFARAARSWFDFETGRFRNDLMRDYFLARKVAREVEAGNVEIFLRYQFPPFVFLFLANLAPELSAKVTEGKFARLGEKMQEEVERKLHLTFAHLLNRPVGMIRAHLNEVREAIGKEKATELARPFSKIEIEIGYISSLAERTRLWQSKPEEAIEAVPLGPLVDEVARSLHEQHPTVALVVEVAPEVQVRAMRGALRDLMQCLLENAFHAAPTGPTGHAPRVAVRARAIGEVLRVEVRDTGEGVPPENRERVFEPLMTTKKGGTGKPRGTGYGLPIARRFAEYMGGRVGLDAESEETCFFVDLVPWREST